MPLFIVRTGVILVHCVQKVMVNLAPDDPSLGVVIPPLKSMHDAPGCLCDKVPVREMRINHYLGSTEDYLERTKRYWEVCMRAGIPCTRLLL